MEGSVEISDGFLINNLYKILYNEYGGSGFKAIFEEIGFSSDIERGNIGDEQVKRIPEWVAKQDEMQNEQIKLIGLLEDFRKVSDNENEFDRQMEIAEKIYEPILKVIAKRMLRGTNQYDNYSRILKALRVAQDHVFTTKEFKRDNIIHQIRVFLLGCYVLYEEKEFWIKQIQEDFNKILHLIKSEDISYTFNDVLSAWTIASLFHDIGRPIEDAKEALEKYKEIYNFKQDFREVFFTVNVNDETHRVNEIPILINLDKSVVNQFLNFIRQAKDDPTSRSIEKRVGNLDHGSVGAILCFNRYIGAKMPPSYRHRRLFPLMLESLVAIALHDNCKFFFCSALTQLLIFCDGLQEWNRVTKISDQKVMIFPCRKIFIKMGMKGNERAICAVIPYERPTDMISQEIFSRFKPMAIWEESRKKFEEATKMKIFQRSFRKGMGLEVHVITNSESFGNHFIININGNNGSVTYKEINIGDIILKR